MVLVNFLLFLSFLTGVFIIMYFSQEIALIFDKDDLNLLQKYVVAASIGFLIVVAFAIILSLNDNLPLANELLIGHFENSLQEELLFLLLSPLIKFFRN